MKSIWIWFQSLSRFGQIGVVSLALHLSLILMLLINHLATARPPVRRPIQVRTTVASSPAVVVANKKAAPSKAKEVKKAPAPKTTPKKISKEPKVSRQAPSIEQNLLQQIVGSLDAIGAPPKAQEPSHFAPRLPTSIEIQSGGPSAEVRPGYGEIVSSILQSNLDLPEFGQVVARIEINAIGSVSSCEILQAKSRKNGEFLKKRLRELVFPCFNEFGITENHLNFTITFHNAENR